MNILVVDVGGQHVKVLMTGQSTPRRMNSGPKLTPAQMAAGVKALTADWPFDVVSLGFPGQVAHNRPVHEPVNLGTGWTSFDYERALGRPVRVINDAAMQAMGSYEGGRMLFLGLGTGLGSAMIIEGKLAPMELGHLPYKNKLTYEDYVGQRGLDRLGKKKWRQEVATVIDLLRAALEPEYIVIGGGNAKLLRDIPPDVRIGNNRLAFLGGFRLWDERQADASPPEDSARNGDVGVGTQPPPLSGPAIPEQTRT
jgi:polyphosphate glucokinase